MNVTPLHFGSICRICLRGSKTYSFKSLFENLQNGTISSKLLAIANISSDKMDEFSKLICLKCTKRLNKCIEFIELCQQSEKKFKELNSMKLCNKFIEDKKESVLQLTQGESKAEPKNNEILNISKAERQHQCSTCGKFMSSRYRLRTHLVTHTKERPFPCNQCDKSFSLSETLNVHKRTHTGEKPFHCGTCGKGFAHSAGLIAHNRKHTGQLPYQCHLCPKRFRTIGHLQYHICKHTGTRNFDCDTCGRAFITRQDLKQHLISHGGEKPHVCCVCGLRLSRASNLRRHIKLAHSEDSSLLFDKSSGIHPESSIK
ncbi:zinc finger protein 239-like isoform X1 [Pieris napi]|uniref:zinc finger protein 239-like isoform X1 n=2 Tax=Pieris napi TaxID=78633 RepID=UPI001FBBC117|nr:zinc finger protein 239-like isoform X1 [Pieris napi]